MFYLSTREHLVCVMKTQLDSAVHLITLMTSSSSYALQLYTIKTLAPSTLTHHSEYSSTQSKSTTKFHYVNAKSCNFSKYGDDMLLEQELRNKIWKKGAAAGNRCSSVMADESFILFKLTTVYCVFLLIHAMPLSILELRVSAARTNGGGAQSVSQL